MEWFNILKLWTFATQPDAVSRRNKARALPSSGVTSPDVIPDIRADGSFWGGGRGQVIRLRDSTDFIDLSSVTNRQSRYKEYERLRNTVEIETAMDVYSDEMCVGGDTIVITPTGAVTIAKLAETRRPDELFMVYCYDFQKGDFVIGWAYHPRKIGTKKTVQIVFSDGSTLTATPDHKVLMRNGEWVEAGQLKPKQCVMAFYRIRPRKCTRIGKRQVKYRPVRVFTHNTGFRNERQMLDELRGGTRSNQDEKVDAIMSCIQNGLSSSQTAEFMGCTWPSLDEYLEAEGMSFTTATILHDRHPDKKRVVSVDEGPEIDVYDMSVKEHANFCTDSAVVHNCQIGDNGHVFDIKVKDADVRHELEDLFFHPERLNVDRMMFSWCKNLLIFGDFFFELVMDPENPQDGIARIQPLPPDSVYRIETIKGKLIEFQQSKSGPDYEALSKVEVTRATDFDLMQSQAIRFAPQQIVHIRAGDERRTFYPYGVSLIEPARGPAHMLRLMDDSALVYRLCLTGKTLLDCQNGLKPIGQIEIGDVVYSYENQRLIPSKVMSVTKYLQEEIYKIRTKRRTIEATGTHPFLVNEGGTEKYVRATDLVAKSSQLVVAPARMDGIPKKINSFPDGKFGRLTKEQKKKYKNRKNTEISDSDRVRDCLKRIGLVPNRKNEQKCWIFLVAKHHSRLPWDWANELCQEFGLGEPEACGIKDRINSTKPNLPEFVNEEFAKLYGFLIGDGCIWWNKNRTGASVQFTGPDDEFTKYYAALMQKYFGRTIFRKEKRSKEGVGDYRTSSVQIARILENLGYKGKANTKKLPEWIFTERPEIRKAMIRGLCDADGHKREYNNKIWMSCLTLSNQFLVEQTKSVWESVGLRASQINFVHFSEEGIIRGRKFKRNDCYRIYLFDTPKDQLETVLSIEKAGKEDVIDISVDHRMENFVAEGVVVHNSRAPERRIYYIDVGGLAPFKAEMVMKRIQDTLRKNKTFSHKGGGINSGASGVEERFQPTGMDEDIFVPIRPNTNTRIETLPGACLALDTEIPLLDGRTLPLQEIIKEFDEGKELWAYSVNPQTGQNAPGLITWAGVTRKNTQVIKLTLDNGETIVCTPDHKFPTQNRGKVEAKDLLPDDSLFPFSKRITPVSPKDKIGYEEIYNTATRCWQFTHRMVAWGLIQSRWYSEKVHCEKYKDELKTTIHHVDFSHFNNEPKNLTWMSHVDHIKYHGDCIKQRCDDGEEGQIRIMKSMSKLAHESLKEKFKDEDFKKKFGESVKESWKKFKKNNPEVYKELCKKISERNKETMSDPEYKKRIFEKQTIVLPDSIWDRFVKHMQAKGTVKKFVEMINSETKTVELIVKANSHIKRENVDLSQGIGAWMLTRIAKAKGYKTVCQIRTRIKNQEKSKNKIEIVWPDNLWNKFIEFIKEGNSTAKAIDLINKDESLIKEFVEVNVRNYGFKFRFKGHFTPFYMKKLARSKGYRDCYHLLNEVAHYNHKVISIEWLDRPQDTGTLTIDGNEEIHNYHTFAIKHSYVYNSNLSEIGDIQYFRDKLFLALKFPRWYMANDDFAATNDKLSALSATLCNHVKRLQNHVADGIAQIANRHLELRGYPAELYSDLLIKFTEPYPINDIKLNQIRDAKYNRAMALMQAQIFSHYDILTKILEMPEDEAKEIVARVQAQKMTDLRMQMMAANPESMGVIAKTAPGQEMGTDANGPSPDLQAGGPEGTAPMGDQQPPGDQQSPGEQKSASDGETEASDTYGSPPKPQTFKFPEPSDEDIKRFDLGIIDYSSGIDTEDLDFSELDDEPL